MSGVKFEEIGHGEMVDKLKYLFIKDKFQEEKEEKEKAKKTHLTVQAMMYFEANWERVPEHLRIFVAAYMWLEGIDSARYYAIVNDQIWIRQTSEYGGTYHFGRIRQVETRPLF